MFIFENNKFDNHSPDMLWSASEWLSNIVKAYSIVAYDTIARRGQEGGKKGSKKGTGWYALLHDGRYCI
jgi:hypothetical protein